MKNLSDVLNAFGYAESNQQRALIKMAAYRGCFKEEFKNKLINEEEVKDLLATPFDTLEIGINWLCEVTQKNWLRASFQKENSNDKHDLVIYTERWSKNEALKIDNEEEYEFYSMFKDLGLIDKVKWPKETISHVVVHGGMEEHAQERMNFLQDFSGSLYYMSYPRGLFNNEPSLAPILASWFNKPEAVNLIQTVLDKNLDMKVSEKNWLKNLGALKQDILEVLGETTWPMDKGWFYKNPEPFETGANNQKRQSLAGWPTAMDMVEFHLEKKREKTPEQFKDIHLCPVYSVPGARIANTEDNVKDWYREYGQYLPEDTTVVFVSNNSLKLHYIPFQDVIVNETLSCINKDEVKRNISIITVGPEANEISLSAATDVFAKIFYTKRPGLLNSLENSTKSENAYSQKDFNKFNLIANSKSHLPEQTNKTEPSNQPQL